MARPPPGGSQACLPRSVQSAAAVLINLAAQPAHRRFGGVEQQSVLHDVVEVDQPTAAAVENGDVPPAIDVRPEILYMLKCLHDFASRSSRPGPICEEPCCWLNPVNGVPFPLRRVRASAAPALRSTQPPVRQRRDGALPAPHQATIVLGRQGWPMQVLFSPKNPNEF